MKNSDFDIQDYEYQLEDNKQTDTEVNSANIDVLTAYFREISKYPLLKPEEEYYYASKLSKPENNRLLIISDVDGYSVSSLNTSLLFNSLCNNMNYKSIIEDLISFSSKLRSSSSREIDLLDKYLEESSKVGRPLNASELKNIFNITSNDVLNELELTNEIRKYKDYVFGFDKLFVSNLRLVVSVANKYHCNMDLMDLINEGNLGLMKAIARFDVKLGNKFSTYAVWWIRESIRRTVFNNNSAVRIPEYLITTVKDFKKRVTEIEESENRSLSSTEIAEYLNMPIKQVIQYQTLLSKQVSLDETLPEDDCTTLKDFLASDYNLEDEVTTHALEEEINEIFEVLNPSQVKIIKMYYGLGEYRGKKYTFGDIAKEFSLSPQRIREKHVRAIWDIRKSMWRNPKVKALKIYR